MPASRRRGVRSLRLRYPSHLRTLSIPSLDQSSKSTSPTRNMPNPCPLPGTPCSARREPSLGDPPRPWGGERASGRISLAQAGSSYVSRSRTGWHRRERTGPSKNMLIWGGKKCARQASRHKLSGLLSPLTDPADPMLRTQHFGRPRELSRGIVVGRVGFGARDLLTLTCEHRQRSGSSSKVLLYDFATTHITPACARARRRSCFGRRR